MKSWKRVPVTFFKWYERNEVTFQISIQLNLFLLKRYIMGNLVSLTILLPYRTILLVIKTLLLIYRTLVAILRCYKDHLYSAISTIF